MKIKDIGNYLEEEDILNLIFFMTGGLNSVWFLAVRFFHTIEYFFENFLFSYSFLSIDKPFLPESFYHYFYHFIISTIIIIIIITIINIIIFNIIITIVITIIIIIIIIIIFAIIFTILF